MGYVRQDKVKAGTGEVDDYVNSIAYAAHEEIPCYVLPQEQEPYLWIKDNQPMRVIAAHEDHIMVEFKSEERSHTGYVAKADLQPYEHSPFRYGILLTDQPRYEWTPDTGFVADPNRKFAAGSLIRVSGYLNDENGDFLNMGALKTADSFGEYWIGGCITMKSYVDYTYVPMDAVQMPGGISELLDYRSK